LNKKPSIKQLNPSSAENLQSNNPDYIRYHKHKNLDLSYFADNNKNDDGFEFR